MNKMYEKMSLNDLIDGIEDMPEDVQVDAGRGFRRLEYISRSVFVNGKLTAGTGQIMIILWGDRDHMILPADEIVSVRA